MYEAQGAGLPAAAPAGDRESPRASARTGAAPATAAPAGRPARVSTAAGVPRAPRAEPAAPAGSAKTGSWRPSLQVARIPVADDDQRGRMRGPGSRQFGQQLPGKPALGPDEDRQAGRPERLPQRNRPAVGRYAAHLIHRRHRPLDRQQRLSVPLADRSGSPASVVARGSRATAASRSARNRAFDRSNPAVTTASTASSDQSGDRHRRQPVRPPGGSAEGSAHPTCRHQGRGTRRRPRF